MAASHAIEAEETTRARSASKIRTIGLISLIAGAILALAGLVTYIGVSQTLDDERITVAEDASFLAGDEVNGPFSAWAQADIIEKHALEASGGATYAELDREDPRRATVMNGSFLRASLFTSILAFGVAAMAIGMGVLFMLLGMGLMSAASALRPAMAMGTVGSGGSPLEPGPA